MESRAVAETEDWLSYEMPGPAVSLAETREYLVVCDNRDNVFYSSLSSSSSCLTWRRADYPASEVRSSRCGEIVWRLYSHTAFCLLQDPSQASRRRLGRRSMPHAEAIRAADQENTLTETRGSFRGEIVFPHNPAALGDLVPHH